MKKEGSMNKYTSGRAILTKNCKQIGATFREIRPGELEIVFADGRKLETRYKCEFKGTDLWVSPITYVRYFLRTPSPDSHNFKQIADGVWRSRGVWLN
jgi:hypothetical protein